MAHSERLDTLTSGYTPSFNFYEESLASHAWIAERIVATCQRRRLHSLLSLGVGHRVVSAIISEKLGASLKTHVVVEGSAQLIKEFKETVPAADRVTLVQCMFEDFTPDEPFDAIEMGFILEHVDDPRLILSRYAKFLNPGGALFISVPNARALHRRIGHQAGLLDNMYRLSEADLQLGHQRYFDYESLTRLVLDAGLKIVVTEGIFLKPITTSQLATLQLPPAVLKALFQVGVSYPDLANAIYVEATV